MDNAGFIELTVQEINYLLKVSKGDSKLAKILQKLVDALGDSVEVVFEFVPREAAE